MSMDLERGQLLDAIDDVATRIARYDLERRLGARDGAPQPLPARRRRGGVLADVRRQHLMREAIRGHQRPSKAISCSRRCTTAAPVITHPQTHTQTPSDAHHPWQSMAINGHQEQSPARQRVTRSQPRHASSREARKRPRSAHGRFLDTSRRRNR